MSRRWDPGSGCRLFIEPALSGHHASYLERLVAAALERGIRPVVMLSDTESAHAAADAWRARLPGAEFLHFPLPARHVRQASGFPGLVRQELAYWRYCRDAYASVAGSRAIDRVFLPYLDYCLYAFGLCGSPFGNTPFEGICMRPGFHYREMGVIAPVRRSDALKKFLFARALRLPTLRRLLTNDETLFLYAQHRTATAWRKVKYFPDPADFAGVHTRDSARKALGIAPGSSVILAYGSLDAEKGLDGLLAGVVHPEAPGSLVLLVAGECSGGTRALLAGDTAQDLRRQGRLVILDRRVTDEEEQMCFAASDISWLGYRDKYCMSGVLVKAVRAGHRVIAASAGVVHWYAARLPQILSVNVENPGEVSAALRHCLDATAAPDTAGGAGIFSGHSWQNCARIVFE
jgi:hypothetical protein